MSHAPHTLSLTCATCGNWAEQLPVEVLTVNLVAGVPIVMWACACGCGWYEASHPAYRALVLASGVKVQALV